MQKDQSVPFTLSWSIIATTIISNSRILFFKQPLYSTPVLLMPWTEWSYFHHDPPFINTASFYSLTNLISSLPSLPVKNPWFIIKIIFPHLLSISLPLSHFVSTSGKTSSWLIPCFLYLWMNLHSRIWLVENHSWYLKFMTTNLSSIRSEISFVFCYIINA